MTSYNFLTKPLKHTIVHTCRIEQLAPGRFLQATRYSPSHNRIFPPECVNRKTLLSRENRENQDLCLKYFCFVFWKALNKASRLTKINKPKLHSVQNLQGTISRRRDIRDLRESKYLHILY